jgi:exopolysaccharide biosynthesis protein
MPTRIQIRRDTTERWTAVNPVLAIGEPGLDVSTHELRVGDGATRYLDLPSFFVYDGTTGEIPEVVLGMFEDHFDGRYRPANSIEPPVTVTVEHKVHALGYPYAVIRARTSGRFIPGLLDKRYGNDFDVINPSAIGTAFKPVRERLDSFARRMGKSVVVNASGWNVTSNPGEVRGAQIRNGQIFHDFEATSLSGSPAGIEGMGLMADGRLRCFSALRGDTAASMVAAGVVHSWSYGPNLVVDGVPQDLTQKNWQYFLTEISARTIVGQTSTGDIVIIATVGKTSTSSTSGPTGITGNDMVSLAVLEGCYNASLFDGGGSTQAYVGGLYTIPSSDDSTGYDGVLGRRSVPDVITLSGMLATSRVDTGWRVLPLRTGFVANDTGSTPMIRQLDGGVQMVGAVKPTSGSFPTTDVVIADIPQQFRFSRPTSKAWRLPGNGSNSRKVSINTDASITIVGETTTPTYITLDDISYPQDAVI